MKATLDDRGFQVLARKRAREQFKPRSPEPVDGRKHVDVQTELYLEEITGKYTNDIKK